MAKGGLNCNPADIKVFDIAQLVWDVFWKAFDLIGVIY
jgi:hypothetical protein